MTLAITTVSTAIAALTVAGVKICDLDKIPPSGMRLAPIMYPDPENPVSNFTNTRMSFGGGSSALEDNEYDLNYVFVYGELGGQRTGLEAVGECISKVEDIIDAILSIDVIAGAVDIVPYPFNVQVYADPSGNNWIGCKLTFHVKEFWR